MMKMLASSLTHRLCLIAIILYIVVTAFLELQWTPSLPNNDNPLSIAKYSFPRNLESAVRTYEHGLTRKRAPTQKIWQTWREANLSSALEAKWDIFLQANPSFERHVITNLADVFPRTFGDATIGQEYFNRTVARLTPGAARADVWRYANLYHYGGIYIDADSTIDLGTSLDIWFANIQRGYDPPIPMLSNESHDWRRQYGSLCQGIWKASNLTLPTSYDRSVLQWMFIFPLPRHPILWQVLHLIDQLIAAATYWDNDQASVADKVLCVTGPAVFTVAVHSVIEAFPQIHVHWEGIDYNGKALFKDPDATPDKLHYRSSSFSTGRMIQDIPSLPP